MIYIYITERGENSLYPIVEAVQHLNETRISVSNDTHHKQFNTDTKSYKAIKILQSSTLLPLCQVPLLLINAEHDFHLTQDALELEQLINSIKAKHVSQCTNTRLQTSQSIVRRMVVNEANHFSIIVNIGRKNDFTTNLIVSFVNNFKK